MSEETTLSQASVTCAALSEDYNQEETANQARAKNGWLAVRAYTKKVYGSDAEPVEQGIRDLLGDIQHLCDVLDLDFNSLLERATDTYECEVEHPLG